ncbi:UNVERIFIED_CONTAM: Limch1 [Trichonephila clavipes]
MTWKTTPYGKMGMPSPSPKSSMTVGSDESFSKYNTEGRGAAMIIESLQLYYHIHCFQCCVCQAQLGNGSCGTDVRVRNNKLHCHNCYSNDEGFSPILAKIIYVESWKLLHIMRHIHKVYGLTIMSKQMVHRWFRQFSEGSGLKFSQV